MWTLWRKTSPLIDAAVAVAQVHAAFADRFHLGPEQHHTRLEGLENVIVVERLPVLRDQLLARSSCSWVAMRGHPKGSGLGTPSVPRSTAVAARRAASRTASTRLDGSARPCPAMSNAGAVIDRGANDRKTQRDVDRAAESHQLDRDQTLIVIAGDHGVELPAAALTNSVSAGQGPERSMPRFLARSTAGASTS